MRHYRANSILSLASPSPANRQATGFTSNTSPFQPALSTNMLDRSAIPDLSVLPS